MTHANPNHFLMRPKILIGSAILLALSTAILFARKTDDRRERDRQIVAALAIPGPVAPLNDWFPPNPYYEDTGDGSGGIYCPPSPPCVPPKVRFKGCEDLCVNAYKDAALALEDFCHDQYDAITNDMDSFMDHIAMETQGCLNDCFGVDACEKVCWQQNQWTSEEAYHAHLLQITAVGVVYDAVMADIRADYDACMQACCHYVTPIR